MPRVAASSDAHTYVPDAEESAAAAAVMQALDAEGLGCATGHPALVAADGEVLELPDAILDALRQVAAALSSGLGVTVAPLSTMLTPQEAADYLGIARPTLVRILERDDAYRREVLKALIEDAKSNDLYAKTDRHPREAR